MSSEVFCNSCLLKSANPCALNWFRNPHFENSYSKRKDEGGVGGGSGGEDRSVLELMWVIPHQVPHPTPPEMGPASAQLLELKLSHICSSPISLLKGVSVRFRSFSSSWWGGEFVSLSIFIYLFMVALGLRFCTRAFSSCREWRRWGGGGLLCCAQACCGGLVSEHRF